MDPLVLRRIALEATNFCEEEYKDMPGPIPWVWEKKLAELIVLECIKVCNTKLQIIKDDLEEMNGSANREYVMDLQSQEDLLETTIDDIEEHFGLSLNAMDTIQ
jgi:hypothetical protein